MFENKNTVNKIFVFRRIVRLRYQDGSSMTEHPNAFQGLINQTTSLEVPLADEVLALLLLGSLPDSWEMLVVVTLGNTRLQGKQLSLEMVKLSLFTEEATQFSLFQWFLSLSEIFTTSTPTKLHIRWYVPESEEVKFRNSYRSSSSTPQAIRPSPDCSSTSSLPLTSSMLGSGSSFTRFLKFFFLFPQWEWLVSISRALQGGTWHFHWCSSPRMA